MATQSKQLFTNNAVSTLASGITAVATTINLNTGDGALFPSPSTNEYFLVTLVDSSNNKEIVKCTSRSTDALTVVRAQEGTTAQAFSAGDAAELRNTRGSMENFAQLNAPQEYNNAHNFNAVTVSDGATVNWNLDEEQVGEVTLAGNRTLAAPTNMKDGGTYALRIKQDATGSRTLTFNAVYKFPNGVTPTLSTAANALDIMTCQSDGTNMYCVLNHAFA